MTAFLWKANRTFKYANFATAKCLLQLFNKTIK